MGGDARSAFIRCITAAPMNDRGWCLGWRRADRREARPIGSPSGIGRKPTPICVSANSRPRLSFESWAPVRLAGGERVQALVFLSDFKHPQWAGDLSLEAQARLIAGASGLSGRNVEYLRDLVDHLREQGVTDAAMEQVAAAGASAGGGGCLTAHSRRALDGVVHRVEEHPIVAEAAVEMGHQADRRVQRRQIFVAGEIGVRPRARDLVRQQVVVDIVIGVRIPANEGVQALFLQIVGRPAEIGGDVAADVAGIGGPGGGLQMVCGDPPRLLPSVGEGYEESATRGPQPAQRR